MDYFLWLAMKDLATLLVIETAPTAFAARQYQMVMVLHQDPYESYVRAERSSQHRDPNFESYSANVEILVEP